ncbi:tyrosine-type recombinase/integrase [Oceanicella sp. SM1341]|uniref:tyrosine-type recombinase/integrase n=1 Tax=Oceanicella sp. SM1341 TaxID=1548889 RepID=UPI0013006580|nr:tyrosine-type recombinase/integrase [Oceanicella sp. SM1341]
MRVALPYVMRERRRDGSWRYRYRCAGVTRSLPGKPGSKEFLDAYHALRRGEELEVEADAGDAAPAGSLEWLTQRFTAAMLVRLESGHLAQATFRQRTAVLTKVTQEHGDRHAFRIPARAIRKIIEARAATPAAANNLLKTLRAMYRWAIEAGLADTDPTAGIGWLSATTEGHTPWTSRDLRRFIKVHPFGTQAHLAMMLLIFTACRRSDLVQLGHEHIEGAAGMEFLTWRQAKSKGLVTIPIQPPLQKALAGPAANRVSIIGRDKVPRTPFLLTSFGRAFTPAGMGNKMQDWTKEAGLTGLSAHGVRKAAGALLAEAGCTEHEVMAILGHASPKTSAVYTRSASRRTMAQSAMVKLSRVNIF